MCISQHDCAAKGGKVVTIPRAPRTTRAVDLATGPIPVGGFCRNDEGSRTVAMMAHRPVVGGRGRGEQKWQSRGEQKGQSRGVSWRFLMARPRSRLPGQARLVPLPTMRAAQWRSRRCPSAPMKISPWVRALMARPAPGTFVRKRDAQSCLVSKEAAILAGDWLDPDAAGRHSGSMRPRG